MGPLATRTVDLASVTLELNRSGRGIDGQAHSLARVRSVLIIGRTQDNYIEDEVQNAVPSE